MNEDFLVFLNSNPQYQKWFTSNILCLTKQQLVNRFSGLRFQTDLGAFIVCNFRLSSKKEEILEAIYRWRRLCVENLKQQWVQLNSRGEL